MKNQLVFQDQKEIERLRVQNRLLSAYEEPILRQLFEGKRELAVLDIGCNDGRKTAECFASEAVARVVGLEYNRELAGKAQTLYGNEKFSFHHSDVESAGFAAQLKGLMAEKNIEGFDVIYLSFVLMHLTDVGRLLTALRPFLKEDGRLMIIEADDAASTLNNDPEGRLGEFLAILKEDRYSGNRGVGGRICGLLQEYGYGGITVWHDDISAGKGEQEKKRAIFTAFFSYLQEDIRLLLEAEPENAVYGSWADWMTEHYEELERLILEQDSEISMGMKILTCTKESPIRTQDGASFFLSPLREEETEEIRQLCDACVGKNLYTSEEILRAIREEDRFFYVLKTDRGEIAGYIYYYLTEEEKIAEYAKLDPALLRAVYDRPGKRVGKIQSVGVAKSCRGRDLATPLMQSALNKLAELSVEAVFIVCWRPDGVIPLKKALAHCGFSYLAEAKRVWYDDEELICPRCGGRCVCDAEVYCRLQEVD